MCVPDLSTVYGYPSSLLSEPVGATVGPIPVSSWATMSLVVVLPDEPVSPTTVNPGNRSTTAWASAAIAVSWSSTSTVGMAVAPGGGTRVASTATAPAACAAAA